MTTKIDELAALITTEQQAQLIARGLDYTPTMQNAIAHIHRGPKYTRVDVGSSGKYMVENETGRIFGIKAYGVIHRGHYFGTLETIHDYNWGSYRAVKKL